MVLFSLVLSAQATQSRDVTELEGSWDLTCVSAELSVHTSLGGTFGGVPAAVDDTFVIPLDCAPSREALDALFFDVARACRNGGFDRATCRDLAHDVRQTARQLSESLAPTAFSLDISESDMFGLLFGLYPATGTVHLSDGSDEAWSYVIDNNDGTRGGYLSLGVGLDALADASGQLGCLGLWGGSAGGFLDPDASDPADAVSWDLDAAGSLVCAADLGGGNFIGGDISIAYTVDTVGL